MKNLILLTAALFFILNLASAQMVVPNGVAGINPSPNSGVAIGTTNPWWQFRATIDGGTFRNGLVVETHHTDDWAYNTLIRVERDLTKAFVVENPNGHGDIFKIYGKGTVHAKWLFAEEIKVTPTAMATWPDYVFEPDYKLKTLDELESFIKENKHLPNVPSAAQVAEEGLNLAEIDHCLLEKIEELTLYVIELKKEIDRLKE